MNGHPASGRRLVAPGALLLAVWFALVGCTDGTGASTEDGPITSRLNAIHSGQPDTDQRAEDARYEEVVAACMKEKGFDYTPAPPDPHASAVRTQRAEDWDAVADAKENGYYITPAGKDALVELYDLGGTTDVIVDEDAGAWFADGDPNGAYYRGLSASDRVAYEEALWGPGSEDEEDEYEYDWKTSGCHGEAFHEVFEAPTEVQDSSVMEDFYAWTDDRAADDPRVREAGAAWVSCMVGKGYSFADTDEAQASFKQRLADLTGIDLTGNEWTPPDPDSLSDDKIRALHDDEVATATADAQCAVDVGMHDIYQEAWTAAETEFYNAHKAEVDSYLEALEAAQND